MDWLERLKTFCIDKTDEVYWAGIFGMAGAASLAVAFFDFNLAALVFGIIFCMIGRNLNRRGKS